jgi:hypothetical protein
VVAVVTEAIPTQRLAQRVAQAVLAVVAQHGVDQIPAAQATRQAPRRHKATMAVMGLKLLPNRQAAVAAVRRL